MSPVYTKVWQEDIEVKSVWLKEWVNEGTPGPEHFEIRKTVIPKDFVLPKGAILVQSLVMSVDPYLRGGLKQKPIKGQEIPVVAERIMSGFIAGKVLESNSPKWTPGDLFGAAAPFSTVQVLTLDVGLTWPLNGILELENISWGIGVLGMPGSTAYAGMDILKPQEGETLFVSAASGAVGSLVGQLAKNVHGAKICIGSCGGEEKGELIKSKFAYDHSIDYKAIDTTKEDGGCHELMDKLSAVAPEGIDMYFENVGGFHFDAAFASLKAGGRVAVCGAISGYGNAEVPTNAIMIQNMIYSGQRIEGFVCSPWLTHQKGNFLKDMSEYIKDGKIKIEETFHEGIENWPVAFQSLFDGSGKGFGKVVVRV